MNQTTLRKLKATGLLEKEAIIQAAAIAWPLLRILGTAAFTALGAKGAYDETKKAVNAEDWKGKLGHGSLAALSAAFIPVTGLNMIRNLRILPSYFKSTPLVNSLKSNKGFQDAVTANKAVKGYRRYDRLSHEMTALRNMHPSQRAALLTPDQLAKYNEWEKATKGYFTMDRGMSAGLRKLKPRWYRKAVDIPLRKVTRHMPMGGMLATGAVLGSNIGASMAAGKLADSSDAAQAARRNAQMASTNPPQTQSRSSSQEPIQDTHFFANSYNSQGTAPDMLPKSWRQRVADIETYLRGDAQGPLTTRFYS